MPHANHRPSSLARRSESRLRQRCQTLRSGESPPGHARYLVPPHGDMHQEGRVAQADHQFSTIKPARHQRDSPLPLSLPPSPSHSKKTVFDAWNGYHSVALEERDRHFTTFITPWGRCRYLTAPQGYIASGDAYTARYDALVAHIGSKTKCIDDALLWSTDITGAFHQAAEWLQICATDGITLNPRKFHFAEDEVEFAGFTITPTEVRPANKFTAAVRDFPTPKSITDVRAWFGLVNQVSYAFSMTTAMSPFRHLLKPSTPFQWTDKLAEALHTSKLHICHNIEKGVQIFDKDRPTCLATDWSRDGMGFWLTQKHCKCLSKDPFCC